jgi:hypothetical protein
MSLAAHRWYFVLKNDIRVEAYTDAYQADVPSGRSASRCLVEWNLLT